MKTPVFIILPLLLLGGLCSAKGNNYELRPQSVATTDTTDVLCLGNSFTYYYDSYNMLAEIAWSQGHYLSVKNSCVGGYSFGCHLAEPKSLKAMMRRNEGYDYVFLQNQSQLNAFIAKDPKRFAPAVKDAKKLVRQVRMYSPDARCIMECTWSFPKYNCSDFGTLEAFDAALKKGTEKLARVCKTQVSPIGGAFALCRQRHPEIKLLYKDNHHQSKEGSYLKSCVNYLMMFGGEFSPRTSDCTLDRDVALKLRKVAEDAVRAYRR